jgi:hypothetical protein
LSRYDETGLCWLLQGKEVIALTADTATIRNPVTGTITTYRRFNKPALGPLPQGDARRWPARRSCPLGYSSPRCSRRCWRSRPMNHPITNAANQNAISRPC